MSRRVSVAMLCDVLIDLFLIPSPYVESMLSGSGHTSPAPSFCVSLFRPAVVVAAEPEVNDDGAEQSCNWFLVAAVFVRVYVKLMPRQNPGGTPRKVLL